MEYKTGQAFTAKINGAPVEGKIYVDEDNAWLCQDFKTNDYGYLMCSDTLGYKYAWKFRNSSWTNNTKIWQVTDLTILPDTDEPKKGDYVEVSDDGKVWHNNYKRIFTGGTTIDGYYIVQITESNYVDLLGWKHIRLAKSPEQVRQEQAEKKAREFCVNNGLNIDLVIGITEYILKTEGK